MYHSIAIGGYNTWDDWHLVPASRPVFSTPAVKTRTVDIPGANGILDFTSTLTGYPVFQNRTGSFEFIVMNGYGSWEERYSEIMTAIHGLQFKACLEDDPYYYYEGRFAINEWRSEKDWSRLVIDYDVGPYKRRINSTGSMTALYNPFNKQIIASSFYSIPIAANSSAKVDFSPNGPFDLYGIGREPVVPVFSVSDGNNAEQYALTFRDDDLNTTTTKIITVGTTDRFSEIVFCGHAGYIQCGNSQNRDVHLRVDFVEGRL